MRSRSGDGSRPTGTYVRAVERQIKARSDTDLKHTPYRGADDALPIRTQRLHAHRTVQERRENEAAVEAHQEVLAKRSGGLSQHCGLMNGLISSGLAKTIVARSPIMPAGSIAGA